MTKPQTELLKNIDLIFKLINNNADFKIMKSQKENINFILNIIIERKAVSDAERVKTIPLIKQIKDPINDLNFYLYDIINIYTDNYNDIKLTFNDNSRLKNLTKLIETRILTEQDEHCKIIELYEKEKVAILEIKNQSTSITKGKENRDELIAKRVDLLIKVKIAEITLIIDILTNSEKYTPNDDLKNPIYELKKHFLDFIEFLFIDHQMADKNFIYGSFEKKKMNNFYNDLCDDIFNKKLLEETPNELKLVFDKFLYICKDNIKIGEKHNNITVFNVNNILKHVFLYNLYTCGNF